MFFSKRRVAKRQKTAEEAAKRRVATEKAAEKAAEREQYWGNLFDRAERGDTEAQNEIIYRYRSARDIWSLPVSVQGRYSAVANLYWTRWQNTRITELLEAWRAASVVRDEVEALKKLLSFRGEINSVAMERLEEEFNFKWDELQQRLVEAAKARYEGLMARREDPKEFARLWKFVGQTRRYRDWDGLYRDGDLREVGVEDLPYPEDWNELLARHYDTPALEAFQGLPDRGPGDVRLLADRAVENDNLTEAQIALAYCNANSRYRAAVGDVLTAQLARVVNRHRAEVLRETDPATS